VGKISNEGEKLEGVENVDAVRHECAKVGLYPVEITSGDQLQSVI